MPSIHPVALKEGFFVHPMLYKSMVTAALFFLALALLVMPYIKPGKPEFYANIIGIILLILFIVLVTIVHIRQARIEIPLEEVLNGIPGNKTYTGKIVVSPDNVYDIAGTEDPRVYRVGEKVFMTYTGRTINYFKIDALSDKTLPVTAILDDKEDKHIWVKSHVYVLPDKLRKYIISDKDAFTVELGDEYYFFNRPELVTSKTFLTIGKLAENPEKIEANGNIKEIQVHSLTRVLEPAKFESKIG